MKQILLLPIILILFLIPCLAQVDLPKPFDPELPFADYSPQLPANPQERLIREKRNRRHNLLKQKEWNIDPKRFEIGELSQTTYGILHTHARPEPAIPAASSGVIVVGEVSSAKAFLSEDRTGIYSEFDININKILKNDSEKPLFIGNRITISRSGGAVRLPSGKVVKRLMLPRPMPRVGSKYVFFLKYSAETEDYPLITAYEIREEKIVPLDGTIFNGVVQRELKSHQTYKGLSETEFLNYVQKAINANSNVFDYVK
jgi:hypothetical protein